MDYLGLLFVFILGTFVGSFLNVVALRYGTDMPIASGRSVCFSCRKKLRWRELVPILSFIILAGRCSVCKSKISPQYLLVEILTGFIFAALFFKFFEANSFWLASFLISATIFSILIIITIYDFLHKIIPDFLVFIFAFLSLIFPVYQTFQSGLNFSATLGLFSGPIFFSVFFLLWFFSKGRWLGLGDAKLALGIGWMLGFVGALSAITFGFWIGAAVSILLLFLQKFKATMPKFILQTLSKELTIKSEIPFAPFLILGTLIIFFSNIDLFHLKMLLEL